MQVIANISRLKWGPRIVPLYYVVLLSISHSVPITSQINKNVSPYSTRLRCFILLESLTFEDGNLQRQKHCWCKMYFEIVEIPKHHEAWNLF